MSARAPVERNSPAVEAAFAAAPSETIAEILDGELFMMPRPARRHTRAATALTSELFSPFDRGVGGPGGWVILDEPELHLGRLPDKLVPNLAGWRRERMPDAFGPDDAPPHYELAPDWVCEILSPATERIDRGRKMRIYRREGVRNAWLMNPVAQTLEVYRLEEGRILLETYEGDGAIRAEPFDALDLVLGRLWAG